MAAPSGITANAESATKTLIHGAMRKTKRWALAGMNLFLERHLDAVRERLQQAKRTGPIGADPALETRQHASLDERHVGEHGEQRHDRDHTLDYRAQDSITTSDIAASSLSLPAPSSQLVMTFTHRHAAESGPAPASARSNRESLSPPAG